MPMSFRRRLIVCVATSPTCATNFSFRSFVCVQLSQGHKLSSTSRRSTWKAHAVPPHHARARGVRRLFETYDYCRAHGIGAYGGGMFEQGPGRGQLQYLASLFHPDGPNDLAPVDYNLPLSVGDLPRSPLEPEPQETGFRWGSYDSRRSVRERLPARQ